MEPSPLRATSAWLPLVMSIAAIALILAHLASAGGVREADEGAAAQLWQLLVAGQLPVIAFFAIRWLPIRPREALAILVLQAAGIGLAAAPVFALGL